MRKLLWPLAVVTVVVLIGGCGGGGTGTVQDFIVGTWELYALSASFSGPKVPIEEFGVSLNVTFDADHSWQSIGSGVGVPPETSAGTWAASGDDYIIHESGEPDYMIHRYGSQFWQAEEINGAIYWGWFRKA